MDHIKFQFISHATKHYSDLDGIRMALEGGCRWIQLRMKDATDDEVAAVSRQAATLCHNAGATLILDDRVGLIRETGADGVHLGRHDMPVDEARKLLGTSYIIGGTANTIDDVRRLHRQGADYIGCGPFRYTTTKANLSPILGLDGYRRIITAMHAEGITLPIVAIGGITLEDIPDILATGVTGIAVSGAILRAADPVQYAAAVGAALFQGLP
ncbi:thiamine phosphate synthase [Prevotella sp. AGR2160]|uniref:thiamine phosphate synthase n=1 Tax=Prevotella sp. AGR2160 TaxID=1280674 RepID=UPI000685D73C|nr:thiamine phosphate synthase [Prevotella sp. AGR2160]